MVATTADFPARLIDKLRELEAAVSEAILGKHDVIPVPLATPLARGRLLIEDVPTVGNTSFAQALARPVSCRFHRL